jgi:YHS domain-containing protein
MNQTNSVAGEPAMADVANLLKRIDAEFFALGGKMEHARAERLQEHRERQKRLAAFAKQMEAVPPVWEPRLKALQQRFGDQIKVIPVLTSTSREVTLEFQSELARIRLRFSAATDREVRKLILNYDLQIIPVFMQFDSHREAEWPLDGFDMQNAAEWLDDRIVDFVRTYLSLHENEHYLKEHMVEDPVAGVRFPKFAAATSLEWGGKTYYFLGEETRREFEATHELVSR